MGYDRAALRAENKRLRAERDKFEESEEGLKLLRFDLHAVIKYAKYDDVSTATLRNVLSQRCEVGKCDRVDRIEDLEATLRACELIDECYGREHNSSIWNLVLERNLLHFLQEHYYAKEKP